MPIVDRAVIGGAVGVALPIVTEHLSKGYRIKPLRNVKLSGLLGVLAGIGGIITPIGEEQGWWVLGLTDEDKALLASFGGSSLATGATILVLDYQKTKVPLKGSSGSSAFQRPIEGLEQKVPEETVGVVVS